MGRVRCRLRLGGGTPWYDTQQYSTIAEYAILMRLADTLLCSVYILSFCTINALKTQKNGRLLCVLLRECGLAPSGALSEAEKYRFMHIICTHKNTHTFLVTAPLSPHTGVAPHIH